MTFITVSEPIAQNFDAIAGALFAPSVLCRHLNMQDLDELASPYISWMLASHALTQECEPEALFIGLKKAVELIDDEKVRAQLKCGLHSNWSTWLAILLLSPQETEYWQRYNESFPPSTEEEVLLRKLVAHILIDEGRQIYDPLRLPKEYQIRYSEPSACVLLKLGMFLRDCANAKQFPHGKLAHDWQVALRAPARDHADRPTRGFAPNWPAFEDLVLALLYLAEWRIAPSWQRIERLIDGYAAHREERMTLDQISLCGSLYGWLEGYSGTNEGLHDVTLRRCLSGQAMALTVRRVKAKTNDVLLTSQFYTTPRGTSAQHDDAPIRVTEVVREEIARVKKSLNRATREFDEVVSDCVIASKTFELSIVGNLIHTWTQQYPL